MDLINYGFGDREAVLRLYRKTIPCPYPDFKDSKILTDPEHCSSFDPQGAVVAVNDRKEVVGTAMVCLKPESPDGILLALFVDPAGRGRGVGSRLLTWIEDYCRRHNRTHLKIGPWVDEYITLGVEQDSSDLNFFIKRGFQEDENPGAGYRPIWMSADMRPDWKMSDSVAELCRTLAENRIQVRISQASDGEAILDLTRKHFQGWYERYFFPNFQGAKPAPVSIAVQGSRVLAFAGPLYMNSEGEGMLGAVGVDPEFRRRGLARAVFNTACVYWQKQEASSAHLWTSLNGPAVPVYEEAGMKTRKVYLFMIKTLRKGKEDESE